MLRRLTAVPLALVVVLVVAWPAAAADFHGHDRGGRRRELSTDPGTAMHAARRGATPPTTRRTRVARSTFRPVRLHAHRRRCSTISSDDHDRQAPARRRRPSTATEHEPRLLDRRGALAVRSRGVTVADGSAVADTQTPYGGNILVGTGSAAGRRPVSASPAVAASNGGGIALRGGRAAISYSLIDNNAATPAARADGILASATASTGNGTTLAIADSTVAFNYGLGGGRRSPRPATRPAPRNSNA